MENKLATISDNDLNKIKNLESNLGIVLVAYEQESDNKVIDKRSR